MILSVSGPKDCEERKGERGKGGKKCEKEDREMGKGENERERGERGRVKERGECDQNHQGREGEATLQEREKRLRKRGQRSHQITADSKYNIQQCGTDNGKLEDPGKR